MCKSRIKAPMSHPPCRPSKHLSRLIPPIDPHRPFKPPNSSPPPSQVSIQPSYYWGYANCDPATQIPDHTPLTQNTPSTFLVTKGDDGEPLGSVSVKLTFAHPTQNQHLPTGAKAVAAYLTLPGCTDLDPSCTVKVADTNGFTGCFSPPTGAWWDRGWVRFEH